MPAPFRGDAAAAAPSGTLGPVSGGVGRGVLDVCRGGGWLLAARSVLKRDTGGRESRPCGGAVPASWGCGAAAPVGGTRGCVKCPPPCWAPRLALQYVSPLSRAGTPPPSQEVPRLQNLGGNIPGGAVVRLLPCCLFFSPPCRGPYLCLHLTGWALIYCRIISRANESYRLLFISFFPVIRPKILFICSYGHCCRSICLY